MMIKIIEFFGLEGSGKTSIKNEILEQNKNDFIDFSSYKNTYINNNRILYFIRKLIFVLKNPFYLFLRKKSKYKYKFIFDIDFTFWLLNKMLNFNKVIILDQGTIQNLIAYKDEEIIHKINKTINKRLKKMKYIIDQFYFINIDEITSLDRLTKRSLIGNQGKFDEIKDKKLLETLYYIKSYNINFIYSEMKKRNFNIVNIDSKKSKVMNAEKIIKLIKEGNSRNE